LAPRAGFEPATIRLTEVCQTVSSCFKPLRGVINRMVSGLRVVINPAFLAFYC
jgi:hypothetical protein